MLLSVTKLPEKKVFWLNLNGRPVKRTFLGMVPSNFRKEVKEAKDQGYIYSYEEGMDTLEFEEALLANFKKVAP